VRKQKIFENPIKNLKKNILEEEEEYYAFVELIY